MFVLKSLGIWERYKASLDLLRELIARSPIWKHIDVALYFLFNYPQWAFPPPPPPAFQIQGDYSQILNVMRLLMSWEMWEIKRQYKLPNCLCNLIVSFYSELFLCPFVWQSSLFYSYGRRGGSIIKSQKCNGSVLQCTPLAMQQCTPLAMQQWCLFLPVK